MSVDYCLSSRRRCRGVSDSLDVHLGERKGDVVGIGIGSKCVRGRVDDASAAVQKFGLQHYAVIGIGVRIAFHGGIHLHLEGELEAVGGTVARGETTVALRVGERNGRIVAAYGSHAQRA